MISHSSVGGGIWATAVAAWLGLTLVIAPHAAGQNEILLADTSHRPRVTVTWPTAHDQIITLQGERAYESQGQKSPLGKNVEAYVALGGTRLDKGAAHPRGALIRVGLYKADSKKLFFEDIAEGGKVTIKLEGVFMNQAAIPRPKTGLMHLKYMLSDLTDCGLDANARNLFNSVDPNDPLKEITLADSGRWGGLDGKGEDHGTLTASVQPDGSVSMVCTFPYPFLRHLKDPYQRSKPGAFFEPQHFHIEIELLPATVPEPASQPPEPPKPMQPEVPAQPPSDKAESPPKSAGDR